MRSVPIPRRTRIAASAASSGRSPDRRRPHLRVGRAVAASRVSEVLRRRPSNVRCPRGRSASSRSGRRQPHRARSRRSPRPDRRLASAGQGRGQSPRRSARSRHRRVATPRSPARSSRGRVVLATRGRRRPGKRTARSRQVILPGVTASVVTSRRLRVARSAREDRRRPRVEAPKRTGRLRRAIRRDGTASAATSHHRVVRSARVGRRGLIGEAPTPIARLRRAIRHPSRAVGRGGSRM